MHAIARCMAVFFFPEKFSDTSGIRRLNFALWTACVLKCLFCSLARIKNESSISMPILSRELFEYIMHSLMYVCNTNSNKNQIIYWITMIYVPKDGLNILQTVKQTTRCTSCLFSWLCVSNRQQPSILLYMPLAFLFGGANAKVLASKSECLLSSFSI